MSISLTERLVSAISTPSRRKGPSRRGFLGGAALVGAAMAVNPWGYLVRPASAYDTVCGADAGCNDGYSAFCCTINNGRNECPPDSFIGGWWKADNSSFCGGSARYYIDCNAFRGGPWQCRCAEGSCDQRRVACNQFRYGQCSLDISAAQTGPVVCRMVSCTPPWQQFAGVCTSSSATDNRTATHSAPCVTGRVPVGSVDVVLAQGGSLRAIGWSYDPDQPSTEIQVAAYVDGVGVGWFPSGQARPDVNAAYGITGRHGFDIALPVSWGEHTVDIYAINVGGGDSNPRIGGGRVTVGKIPLGALDVVSAGPDSRVRLQGWAFDPDEPATSISVAVYRDGQGVAWFPTGGSRPDVNSVFGIPGSHGFDITVECPPGDHGFQVYAINVGGGVGNPLVGQGQVRVGIAQGRLDAAAGRGTGGVRLQGWAFDPDQPSTPISVAVYRDGTGVGWFPTGQLRSDVNSVFGITGNHGFTVDLSGLTPGAHTFDMYAINVGPQADNTYIGTRVVSVQ